MNDSRSVGTGARSVTVGRAVSALAAMLLLAGCGSSSEDPPSGEETSSTSSEEATRSTIEFPTERPLCDTAEQCAESLYWAWIAADRPRAAGIATSDAVDSLFANTYQPTDDWQYNGCSGAMGSTGCQWTDITGRTLMMIVPNGTGSSNPPPPPPFEVVSANIS